MEMEKKHKALKCPYKTVEYTKDPSHQKAPTISTHQDNLSQTTKLEQKYPEIYENNQNIEISTIFPLEG